MENNKPLVSVIMNCYNSDKYLKEAIDSVLAQTYTNWEIIFWDNQSIDKSAEIVKSYSDKRIKYFYAPKHTLLGEARNLAVEKTIGEWIAFLDCDDIWYVNKLEIQLQNISNDIGMIYTRMEFLLETSGLNTSMSNSVSNNTKNIYPKRKKLPSGDIFDKLLFDCFIPLPSVLIKTDLFNQVGGIDKSLKLAEDYDIFLKIALITKVKAIDSVLCKYRVHENNLSHQNMEKTFEESLKLVKKYSQVRFAKDAISYWNCKKEYYKDSDNILSKLKYVFKVLFNKVRGIL
jgi:glycosyltransferase involved in cell wall biosynthesis